MKQSRMDHLETHATLGTIYRTKANKAKLTTEEIKEMRNTDSRKNCGVEPGARKDRKVTSPYFLSDIHRIVCR